METACCESTFDPFPYLFAYVNLNKFRQIRGFLPHIADVGCSIAWGVHLHQTVVSRELRHVVITSQWLAPAAAPSDIRT